MKNLILCTIAFCAITLVNSCAKEKSASSYTDNVDCTEADDNLNVYSGKISTILNTNCAISGCHNAITKEDGKDFSSYGSAKGAFDATALCSINHDGGCATMPRNAAKLSDAVIHDLTCWVKNDYPQ